jgi:hypothetical protein
MRTLTALIVLVACCATATSISAGSSGKANLRLVDRDPLTVQGRGFKSRERVRVVASLPESAQKTAASETVRKTIRATAAGSFRVVFSEISVDRCSLARVTTVGARGSQADLKVLPSPMCTPARLP